MTTTLNTTESHRPAKLSPPSDRDLEIFQHAEIHGGVGRRVLVLSRRQRRCGDECNRDEQSFHPHS